jgi:DNA-binding LytR/AlgR family response regulator
MNCIAIDDEPVALSVLARYCERMGGMELKTYSDPVVGMHEVLRAAPDLLFLDIRMGEISGVELAREIPKGTFLVFTTAYAQYAVDGFDLDAVDFLHKPFSYPRFCRAVEKARQLQALRELSQRSAPEEETITVKVEYRNVKIPLSEIVYIGQLCPHPPAQRTSGAPADEPSEPAGTIARHLCPHSQIVCRALAPCRLLYPHGPYA